MNLDFELWRNCTLETCKQTVIIASWRLLQGGCLGRRRSVSLKPAGKNAKGGGIGKDIEMHVKLCVGGGEILGPSPL